MRDSLIVEFVCEAMANGWFTLGPADDVIPPGLQDALPGHRRVRLTQEGQHRLDELFEKLRSQGLVADDLNISGLFS